MADRKKEQDPSTPDKELAVNEARDKTSPEKKADKRRPGQAIERERLFGQEDK